MAWRSWTNLHSPFGLGIPKMGGLQELLHSLRRPCHLRLLMIGISYFHALGFRGYCFQQGNGVGSLRWMWTRVAIKAWPIAPCVVHISGLMPASIIRRQVGIFSGAKKIIVPNSFIMSLPNSGVGFSGMIKKEWMSIPNSGVGFSGRIKKEWENTRLPHRQPKGWEKYLLIGLPITLWTVTCRLERIPGLERRME